MMTTDDETPFYLKEEETTPPIADEHVTAYIPTEEDQDYES